MIAPSYLDSMSAALFRRIAPVFMLVCGLSLALAKRGENPEEFWAFQRLNTGSVSHAGEASWSSDEIDRFILEKLKQNQLSPSKAASKRDLIRRATYDLHGLPPTPEEISDFLKDDSPKAYERLIDRLLESPHYGEKWGQHWLDVIRFSESEGFEYDRELPGAWRFRDYVIRSINEDKPFDQFITEQLAGDEREDPKQDQLIAAGFHRFGPVRRNAGNPDIALSRNEVLTERTDIIGSAFMGLTMGCARCHDHKLDPISHEDYYSLQAFVASTQELNHLLGPKEEVEAWHEKTNSLKEQLAVLNQKKDETEGEEREKIKEQISELNKELPEMLPNILTIENDPEKRTEVRVLRRGEWKFKGELVDMRPPEILNTRDPLILPPDEPRPRTRLAQWITSRENPLTARVLANRVWQNHFGKGIVDTPNDFGYYGDRPSHPRLLDYLADRLIRNDWRLKPMHRAIMLSKTYRQSSRTETLQRAREIDPENRLLWKFNRRRLLAEEIRDSLLSVSGVLNKEMYGESVMVPVEKDMIQLLYAPDQWQVTKDKSQHNRRSVYLVAKRNLRLPFMEAFDQPTLQASCAQRESSTHAPQALELLNGDIANDLALEFAKRLRSESSDSNLEKIEKAWLLTTGRPPSSTEEELASGFIENHPLSEFALALFNLNEFLYVR